jgi:hypothetical protein
LAIERFVWIEHALLRLDQRHLERAVVEQVVQDGHERRQANEGRADWLVEGVTAHGARLEAVYDHPAGDDEMAARIVSVWQVDP